MRATANQQQNHGIDIDELNNATPLANRTDTDGDGMYDSVEWVLGTDYNNTDSDFDQLDDYYEAKNNLDPLNPDSNGDGLADYFEVTNVSSLDVDGDGFPNAWDFDNDGDGVIDALDLSPFSRSTTHESIHFNITTNGNPAYVNFQLRPKNPDHLRQALQTWVWPIIYLGFLLALFVVILPSQLFCCFRIITMMLEMCIYAKGIMRSKRQPCIAAEDIQTAIFQGG